MKWAVLQTRGLDVWFADRDLSKGAASDLPRAFRRRAGKIQGSYPLPQARGGVWALTSVSLARIL